MRRGQLRDYRGCGCLALLLLLFGMALFPVLVHQAPKVAGGVVLAVGGLFVCIASYGLCRFSRYILERVSRFGQGLRADRHPYSLELATTRGPIRLYNPFRGILVVGAAGSGKSESIALPLMRGFAQKGYTGVLYDFKFPSLTGDMYSLLAARQNPLPHYFLNFHDPLRSYRVNPLHPRYLPHTGYAREYATAIVSNLMRESIRRPDFWTRSATDLLTACIWYLRSEHPEMCDLPHVLALVTSPDEALLKTLKQNEQCAQMTVSILGALERGAENQVSGVVGTLQGAIAQINTPEICYLFGGDDFSLDINDPENPIVLSLGSHPSLAGTYAPLCSLVITVATRLMNQPGKHHSFLLLDEGPTLFIPHLDLLPNTARSNRVATVFMCQDLAQMVDMYGTEKADVLSAALNTHFYGRVSSSKTARFMSEQFGRYDQVYTTSSASRNWRQWLGGNEGKSETVQERDRIRASAFLRFPVGRFAGIAVESNMTEFNAQFRVPARPPQVPLPQPTAEGDMLEYYRRVRREVNSLLVAVDAPQETEPGKRAGQDPASRFRLDV
ncbi:type IV secretion system coupling TraD/TrwB family protein [Pontibacter mucosus]|uniref:Type IV secretion system coupling TraD/TrwB family protein n=1 Tax=Pontibacter mucosus TaxID=1649266 RepID=A0A2T5YDT7_9BACT|nr:type IV secretory system conjugative DNA transfer family protein [Pontibacter mucosus]PTX14711.1 type IV secretion system coupling TraD/TrwB family protein [Pontibacter mucosus]